MLVANKYVNVTPENGWGQEHSRLQIAPTTTGHSYRYLAILPMCQVTGKCDGGGVFLSPHRKYIIITLSDIGFIEFEWDEAKQKSNFKKHGVSFQEAISCFFDVEARLQEDTLHSVHEERFILMGWSNKLRLLLISHTYVDRNKSVRIISARKASTVERFQYKGFKQ